MSTVGGKWVLTGATKRATLRRMATQNNAAAAIERHRQNAGDANRPMSYYDIAVGLRAVLPPEYWGSPEKVRRYAAGLVPEELMDAVFLGGLAEVLHCQLADLSPLAASRMKKLKALSARFAVTGTARSDLRDQTTGCLATSAA